MRSDIPIIPGGGTDAGASPARTRPVAGPATRLPNIRPCTWTWCFLEADGVAAQGGVTAVDPRDAATRACTSDAGRALVGRLGIHPDRLADIPANDDPAYLLEGTGWALQVRIAPQEIMARLVILVEAACARRQEPDQTPGGMLDGAVIDLLLPEERAQRDALLLALPADGELREAARQRIAAWLAAGRVDGTVAQTGPANPSEDPTGPTAEPRQGDAVHTQLPRPAQKHPSERVAVVTAAPGPTASSAPAGSKAFHPNTRVSIASIRRDPAPSRAGAVPAAVTSAPMPVSSTWAVPRTGGTCAHQQLASCVDVH